MASKSIRLDDALLNEAEIHAEAQHRSVPKQVEYWARLGKIGEDNPELPISMIKDILLAQEEVKADFLTAYEFG